MNIIILTDHKSNYKIQGEKKYLGEWSINHQIKFDENLKTQTYDYHWNDRNKLFDDFKYLQNFNHKLIQILTKEFNHIHGKQFSSGYWSKLLGYWVNTFTSVLFDRWSMIEKLKKDRKNISRIITTDFDLFDCVTSDFPGFLDIISKNEWNLALYSYLIKNYTKLNFSDEIRVSKIKIKKQKNSFFKKKIIIGQNYLSKNNEIYFANTYCSLKFQRDIFRSIRIFHNKIFPVLDISKKLDQNLRLNFDICNEGDSLFEMIAKKTLPIILPSIFLESYEHLDILVDKYLFPKKSKKIFTSNSHYTNSVFMHWAAKKCESGSKLYIGEHGSNHIGKFNGTFSYDNLIADKVLTKGNLNKGSKYVHIGDFKSYGKENLKWSKNGFCTIVTNNFDKFTNDLRSMPLSSQVLDYYSDLHQVFGFFSRSIKIDMKVKLYSHDYGWNHESRWTKNLPDIKIMNYNTSIYSSFSKSRLVILTYNGTTTLEAMHAGVPVILYWNKKFWELSDNSNNVFLELRKSGVFHDNKDSFILHLTKIWADIPEWWNSSIVQDSRKKFCEKFCSNKSIRNNFLKAFD